MGIQLSRSDPLFKLNQELEEQIRELQTKLSTHCEGGPLRIVLCGPVNAGKSSLVNNIMSAFEGKVVQIAGVGTAYEHITTKYTEYKVLIKNMEIPTQNVDKTPKQAETQLVVCDTRGVDKESPEEHIDAVKAALAGDYSPNQTMCDKPNPSNEAMQSKWKRQAVYIIIVVEANAVKSGEWKKDPRADLIKKLQLFAIRELIPVSVFLTKCDRLDKDVNRDMGCLYKSKIIEEARNCAHQSFNGLTKNRIFPIVNYTHQMEADPMMRMQIFKALKYILDDVECYMKRVVRIP